MQLWEQTLHGNLCTDQWDVRDVQDAAQDVRDREWAGSPPIPVNSAKSRLLRPDMDGVHGGWACLCVSVFHDQGH